MDPISGIFPDLGDSLVTIIVFPLKKLILYLVLSVSLVFISTISTISLCISLVYLRELPILKGKVGVLICVESLQTLFDGFFLFLAVLRVPIACAWLISCVPIP